MSSTQSNENKGLFSMFGGIVPVSNTTTTSAIKTTTKAEEPAAGGGAWKTATRKTTSRGLALKAKALGKRVTIAKSQKTIVEDGDDITMGGMGNKKKKRYTPYGGRAKQVKPVEQQPDKRVDVLVSGFEPGTEAGVVPYLVLKSKKQWEPVDVKVDQGKMLITVNDPAIARILIRLDGYLFGTQQLKIALYENSALPMTPVVHHQKKETTIDILRNFLLSRWNSDAKYLNLDSMKDDPILKKNGIKAPGVPGANAVVGPAMMKLAGEMFGNDVITLSIGNNHLKNVQQVSTLAQYLPNIQNLSFQNNLIKEYEGLEALSGTGKLRSLKELLLAGNPLRDSEIKQRGNDRAYIRNIVKRFPSIVLLDGVAVVLSEEEIGSVHKTGRVLPLDNKPNYFDTDASQTAAVDFLSKYLHCFDSNRASLTPLYDQNAIFSITSNIKLRSQQKLRRKDKKKLMMDDDDVKLSWTSMSRNLMAKSKTKQEDKGLFIGPDAIGATLPRLPNTAHEISNTNDNVVDAVQTPVGLLITVHGEFKEDESSSPYSYDRVFLLRPAVPDTPAAAAGWPYIIMSDTLCVRDYIGNQGFKPQVAVPISTFASYPGA
ncbi:NTF2-like protein [Backusella circina FSU 941]|nr:NTF2-like protein [Backusella circina FSU 941]